MERDGDAIFDGVYGEVRPGGTSDLPAGSPQQSMFEIEFSVTFFRRDQTAGDEESSEQECVTMTFMLSLLLSVLLQSPMPLHSAMSDVLYALLVRPRWRRVAALVDDILELCGQMAVGVPSDGRFMRVGVDIEVLVDELPSRDAISELSFGDQYAAGYVRFVAAKEEAIAGLEKVRVRVSEKECCVVCLEDILVGSEATRLPCLHQFHGDCIINWQVLSLVSFSIV